MLDPDIQCVSHIPMSIGYNPEETVVNVLSLVYGVKK